MKTAGSRYKKALVQITEIGADEVFEDWLAEGDIFEIIIADVSKKITGYCGGWFTPINTHCNSYSGKPVYFCAVKYKELFKW